MLSIAKRQTITLGSQTWEYHGDDESSTIFYVTPMPMFATLDNGLPAIQIIEYQNAEPTNGSGYCQIQVELGIPQDDADTILTNIKNDITQKYGVSNPDLQTLAVKSGTVVTLNYPTDPDNPTVPGQAQAAGSDFGSNRAVFEIPLSSNQMKLVKAQMASTGQSPFSVSYNLVVLAITPGVEVQLSFDANIAYEYEVTVVRHVHETEWSESVSYTYDIEKYLNESNASTISVTQSDPNLPPSVIDDIRTWCMTVIEQRVQEEVADAQALLDQGGGTESFSINQVSSFQESYNQSETMPWTINPQASLPTFPTLGVTVSEQAELEPIINTQGFTVTVSPHVYFVGSDADKSKKQGNLPAPTSDPFTSSIRSLISLEVTVIYPSLPGGSLTKTFTDNTPQIWTADLNSSQGNVYDLQYTAVYSSPDPKTPSVTFSGEIKQLDATVYDLTLENIGTLYVNFDATGLFANSNYAGVDSVEIDLIFSIPNTTPYVQQLFLPRANAKQTVFSICPAPIETDYVYTITYNFNPSTGAPPFITDVKQSQTREVFIDYPDSVMPVNILTNMGDPSTTGFAEFSVDIYYDGTLPNVPPTTTGGVLPLPTSGNPIHFSYPSSSNLLSATSAFTAGIPTSSSSGASGLVRGQVFLFANSQQTPFTILATGTKPTGEEVTWGPYNFSHAATNQLSFSQEFQFAFIEIDPTIVDWENTSASGGTPAGTGALSHVSVNIVSIHYLDSAGAQHTILANKGLHFTTQYDSQLKSAPHLFYPVLGLPAGWSNLTYDWVAQYVYTKGTGEGATCYVSNANVDPSKSPISQSGNLELPANALSQTDPTPGILPKPKVAASRSNAQSSAGRRLIETVSA